MNENRQTHPGGAGLVPDVSVIIINWNLRDLLRRCLESVRRNSEGLSVEIVVVDNNSRDGSAGMVEDDFPEAVLMVNSENSGFGRASNQGMDASKGRYLFLLNNDATLFEGALAEMIGYMDAHPEAGACGPRVVNPDGSLQVYSKGYYPSIPRIIGQLFLPRQLRHPAGRSLGLYEYADRMEERDFEWLSGCALMARRPAVEEVGSLNADVFMYCEDMDWCHRMRLAGWKVMYLPRAKVEHLGGQSMKLQQGAAVGSHAAGLMAFYSRYHGRSAAAVFRAVLLTGYAVQTVGWLVAAVFGRGSGLDKLRRVFRKSESGNGGGR